jgi:hypothetical protein
MGPGAGGELKPFGEFEIDPKSPLIEPDKKMTAARQPNATLARISAYSTELCPDSEP